MPLHRWGNSELREGYDSMDTEPDKVPDQPTDPPCATPAELEDREWAEVEGKRWEYLSGALENLFDLTANLTCGTHLTEGLMLSLGVERREEWSFVLRKMDEAIKNEMANIRKDLLDAGFAPPEGALEEI